jgi:hypothetical protein
VSKLISKYIIPNDTTPPFRVIEIIASEDEVSFFVPKRKFKI